MSCKIEEPYPTLTELFTEGIHRFIHRPQICVAQYSNLKAHLSESRRYSRSIIGRIIQTDLLYTPRYQSLKRYGPPLSALGPQVS